MPPQPADAGLQAERTRLAWRRTTLSIAVVLLLAIARLLGGQPWPAAIGVLAIAVALGAGMWVANRRLRMLTAVPADASTAGWAPAALGLLTVAAAVASAVVVV
jgi:hypothetical protein